MARERRRPHPWARFGRTNPNINPAGGAAGALEEGLGRYGALRTPRQRFWPSELRWHSSPPASAPDLLAQQFEFEPLFLGLVAGELGVRELIGDLGKALRISAKQAGVRQLFL